MKKQLYIFFAALMFLTRLPIPKWVVYKDEYLQKTTRYFTTVGLLIGTIVAAVYYVGSLVLPNTVAILISIAASILLTGAFHEDGFADVCDAFGGGYTKEKILEIMKDSRLGTYGTVGLIMLLLLKYFLLLELSTTALMGNLVLIQLPYGLHFPVLIIASHSLSRFMPIVTIQSQSYVFQNDLSKSKPLASQKMGFGSIVFAFAVTLIPFLFLPITLWAAFVFMFITAKLLGRYFNKHIQGYTGDCLGTVQQVTEQVFFICVFIINKIVFF
jgi:adenosylcobinamide-GDP ribazoletransferase